MTDRCLAPIRGYSQWAEPQASGLRHGFAYRVSGTVTKLGLAGAYKVRLYIRANGVLYAETWSSASGAYQFDLVPLGEYYVVAFDHGGNPVNAAISDYLTPEPMDV